MTVNADQAIFDAIAAAIKDQSLSGGITVIDVQKFIDTFNGHRDRKLCTSLDVAHSPPAFHAPHNIGERLPSGDAADAGGEAIRRANLRKRLLNLIRSSTLSASMHPLTETLMRLDDPEADLDMIEQDVRRYEET